MAYQTIRDLIGHVRSVHRRLRESVREAEARADDERFSMLLDFIAQHEATLERAVEAAEREGRDAVLDTWLQFEPHVELERASKQLDDPDSKPSSDDVVVHVLETENGLIRLYELLQGATSSASVQSFFASLLSLEDAAVRLAARVRIEAGDL